jgi:hypothetical protein
MIISTITMGLLFLLIALISLAWGLWLVRINRWPRVSVKVLQTRVELTGSEGGAATGWLHADLEYCYRSKTQIVRWRGDLQCYHKLPASLRMRVDLRRPDQLFFSAGWKLSIILILLATMLGLNALNIILNG